MGKTGQEHHHHARTLSANVPYSTNYGRVIHTNIGNLDNGKLAAPPVHKMASS
jgi:hypothetical protein